ncbi:MAG: glycosyltransferase family 2 protein [Sporolactobacillus sp.]
MTMNLPLLSIIVPVYNVASYLDRCVTSLIEQTYTHLEILLVDDGSTDRSSELCDAFAKADQRVHVIHQSNQGVAAARNHGLNAAAGEYIGFVDSDDWVAADMYMQLYKQMSRTDAQIVCCGHWRIDEQARGKFIGLSDHFTKRLDHDEALSYLIGFKDRCVSNYLWDKLFVRSLFDKIRFPNVTHFEDVAVLYQLFDQSSVVYAFSEPLYYYYQRNGSLMHEPFEQRSLVLLQITKKIILFSQQHRGLFNCEAYAMYACANLFLIQSLYRDQSKKGDYLLRQLVQNLRDMRRNIRGNPFITRHDQLFMGGCTMLPVRQIMRLRTCLQRFSHILRRIYQPLQKS